MRAPESRKKRFCRDMHSQLDLARGRLLLVAAASREDEGGGSGEEDQPHGHGHHQLDQGHPP